MSKYNANVPVKQAKHRFERDAVYAPGVPYRVTGLSLKSINCYHVVAKD